MNLLKRFYIVISALATILCLQRVNAQNYTDTLALNYYYVAGVPTINKVWVGEDYITAATVLKKIASIDRKRLPRKKSGNGSSIFNKIMSIENYQVFDTTYYTLPMQFQFSNQALQAVKTLMLVYYSSNGTSTKIIYSNEVTDCGIAMLFLLEKQLDITLSFFSDTTKLSEAQKNGLKQAKRGLNTVISGMFMIIQKDYPAYERLDIEHLAAYFFPFYHRLKKIMESSDIIEFDKKEKAVAMNHDYKEVRDLVNK